MILRELSENSVPVFWQRYTIPIGTTANQWMGDFLLRINQLQKVSDLASQGGDLQKMTLSLGGLFDPEAYAEATRQCVAAEAAAVDSSIKHKDNAIQTQTASLQQEIVPKEKVVESRTQDYLGDWEKMMPVEGHMRPNEQLFETRCSQLVGKAKEALELQETGPISTIGKRMQVNRSTNSI